MTVVPHAGSRRTVLHRTVAVPHATRTGVMSTSAFAMGALAVMSIGLLAVLVLNTALAKGSFRAHELRIQKADLAQREQVLRTHILEASSPVTLSKRAQALGLVPATAPVFIRLADGSVAGEPYPAGAPLDPVTGEPVVSDTPAATGQMPADAGAALTAPAEPADPAAQGATAGDPAVPVTPESPATPSGTGESATSPGVATAPGTDTEQPLGITE